MLRRRWLWLLPPLLGAAPLGAATLTDLSAPAAEEAPAAPALAVGEVYAEGAFALVYAGPETGLKEGDRVPVRRYGRVLGHWVVTHVARDITRGRFEAREAGEVMKPTDTLDTASRQMAPAPQPPASTIPTPKTSPPTRAPSQTPGKTQSPQSLRSVNFRIEKPTMLRTTASAAARV